MFNLSKIVHDNAMSQPEAEALIYQDVRLTWIELDRRVNRLAGALAARGVRENSVVALLMKNSIAYVELIYAISHLGAIILPLNFRLSAGEVLYITDHAGAQLILTDEELAGAARDLDIPVIALREACRKNIGDALAAEAASQEPIPVTPRGQDDVFRIMYTSGTTSRPKGVVHTYANYYWKCYDHILSLGLSQQSRLLIAGPLYHVGACDLPGLAVHLAGGVIVILRDFDSRRVLDVIAAEKIDGVWLAPVMTNEILSLPPSNLPDNSSLRWCIAGGERTPESRIRLFMERFRNARYIDAYGMTETCSGDTLMDPGRELQKIGSVGRALRFIEIEIRDNHGIKLRPGEEGEICMRGPKVTRAYWRDAAATSAAFHPDGFLRSGDIGYMDQDGFLFITDRQKDMIISGGENIASSEVERVIYNHPAVKEAAVFARPDQKWGEIVVAAVVLAQGKSLTFDELLEHCQASLARFKCPKNLIILEELPRNPSGKVLKRLLREWDKDRSQADNK